ncbi:hypothetical protein [Rubellicoccus peritrichatus]|uniref:Uncharacterized protein n=1 Tax=Rubellicoccus peritrichatus TaxID=3080537 RepID=A0AAQ3L6S1_9BACT|nr:hypothetical protein [Puniceicoccus sp. CR14]WOO40589.1 hypothetical protein RZN69_18360 [Puniceicoccus sp. CR14]
MSATEGNMGTLEGNPPASAIGMIGAIWGILGVTAIIGSAVWRLTPYAIHAFDYSFSVMQWVVFVGFTIFMAFGEGYRGFQKAFSPRVAARALHLSKNPVPLRVIFAPFFCMGFFGATRKRKIVTWCLTTGIVILVILVRQLEQPWRGIIDFGVVLGLGWGIIAMWIFCAKAFFGSKFDRDPEVA